MIPSAQDGSYYVVSGLTPGATYTVSLTEMTGGGSLNVFQDSDFTITPGLTCNSSNAVNLPEICQLAANASGRLYINASETGLNAGNATTFNIRVQ
jgi:hypothetical protein